MASKQKFPDQSVGFLGASMPTKYLPLTSFVVLLISLGAGLTSFGEFIFMSSGFGFGWLYLRFFQKREHGRGDLSESFAFQTFFPEPVASVVGVLSAVVFVAFKPILMVAQGGNSKDVQGVVPPLPQSTADPADAERRRQRAQRVVEERMNASKSNIGAPDDADLV